MSKRNRTKTFGEDVAKLVFGVDFDEFNVTRAYLLSEPMILDGVVLGTRSHPTGLEFAEGQGTNIVLVDFYMKIGNIFHRQATGRTKFLDEIEERK